MMHGPINIRFFLVFLSLDNLLKLMLEHFISAPIPGTHLTDSSSGGAPELLWKEWKTEKAIFQPGIKLRFPGNPGRRLVTVVTVLHSVTF